MIIISLYYKYNTLRHSLIHQSIVLNCHDRNLISRRRPSFLYIHQRSLSFLQPCQPSRYPYTHSSFHSLHLSNLKPRPTRSPTSVLPFLAASLPLTLQRPTSPSPSSSSEPDGPFEGPEKLLELWFSPSVEALPPLPPATTSHPRRRPPPAGGATEWQGLRAVPREVWEDMLDIVKCKVLSFVEGEEIDAYLLS